MAAQLNAAAGEKPVSEDTVTKDGVQEPSTGDVVASEASSDYAAGEPESRNARDEARS